MVLRLLARVDDTYVETLLKLLTSEGVLCLAELIASEEASLEQFILSYESGELNKISKRMEDNRNRVEAGQEPKWNINSEDIERLNSASKAFSGKLSNGTQLQYPESVAAIQSLLTVHKRKSSLKRLLVSSTEGGTSGDRMFFGKRLSELNLNPSKLYDIIYNHLHVPGEAEWIMRDIAELLELKMTRTRVPLFEDTKPVERILQDARLYDSVQISEMVRDIKGVMLSATTMSTKAKTVVTELISSAVALDRAFDPNVYEELHPYIPSYHKVHAKWLFWFLRSFMDSSEQKVSPWITYETLVAFYRKGVEILAAG